MEVKFWDSAQDYLRHKEEIDKAIQDVLSSGKLILGYSDEISKFEESFAKFVGVKHAIMVGGGTHALYLAYRALLKPGDEVITTSHTFIATIDQIIAVGAIPILVDIDEETGLIDPLEIEKAITPRTRAVVPVHLEGKVCDMGRIIPILNRAILEHENNIWIIDDSAQAIGAQNKFQGLSNCSCYSMFPAKVLGGVGNAGMVTTNDDKLAERLRMLRCNSNFGKNPDLNAEFGMQLEPDAIQAAVLNVRFKYLEADIRRRAEIARMYDEGLADLPIKLALKQEGRVYQDYVIRVLERKEELVKHLQDNGVGIIGHNLIPNHRYKVLSQWKLPKTDKYIAQQIRIPCRPGHTDEEINYVIKTIREFYGK